MIKGHILSSDRYWLREIICNIELLKVIGLDRFKDTKVHTVKNFELTELEFKLLEQVVKTHGNNEVELKLGEFDLLEGF